MNRRSQGFSIGSHFNYSSHSFRLSDEEFEVFKIVNEALLSKLIDERKRTLEQLDYDK